MSKVLIYSQEDLDLILEFEKQENEELQQENKQLKERIEYLERSNNRREDTILEQRQKISDLEDKIPYIIQNNSCKYISIEKCKNKVCVNYKMQELERGEINE